MTAGSISNWFERDRRHAVLLRQQRGDLLVLDVPELHEVGAELAPVRALVVQRLLELFRRDALLFEKQFADPNRHGFVTTSMPSACRLLKRHPRADTPRAFSSWPRTRCASTNIPGFIPRRCRGDRRARIADRARRTPPRKPSRWLIHQSRRRPRRRADRRPAPARDIRSPSTDTTTREIPGQPLPTPRRRAPRDRSSTAPPSAVARTSGVVRLRADETEPKLDSPTPSRPASTSTPQVSPEPPRTSFRRRADDDVFAERLHQRHADRRRREGVHTAPHFFSALGARHCRLSGAVP